MYKNKGLIIIILILFFGGFIFLSGFNSGLNPLAALAGIFSLSGDKESETVRLLDETRFELANLQEEIYLMKEKLEEEKEMRVKSEAKYRSEVSGLAVKVENLTQMANNFNREMAKLAIYSDPDKELAPKSCFININTASKEDLQELVGIGPVLAQRIIDARPFSSVHDLIRVDGIGGTTLDKIIAQACAYVAEAEKEAEDEEVTEEGEEVEEEEAETDVCPVNINTASKEELQAIIGIGPALAQRIIEGRPFSSVHSLIYVSGIGQTTLDNIIAQGCAYVENDKGFSSHVPVFSSGGGGGSSVPSPVTYPEILISEVQISPTKERFIELYNPNEQEVDLTGWYIQRKTKGATSWGSLVVSSQFEEKVIQSKGYFIISRTFGDSDILLESLTLAEDNSIVLKNPKREIVDLVGWGEASDFKTSPFPENPKTRDLFEEYLDEKGIDYSSIKREGSFTVFHQSLGRKVINEEDGYGYQDTANNAEDFEIQVPTPCAKNKTFLEQELKDILESIKDYYSAPIVTEIISGPASSTEETNAVFEFQANKEYCYFECRLNEEEWQECESPKIYENLEQGEYFFSVRAIDLFSNMDLNPPKYVWVVKDYLEQDEPEPPTNLLLNEFFEEWEGDMPEKWLWDYTSARIGQDDTDPLKGDYNVWLKPIASHNILAQMISGISDTLYHGVIWVKGVDGVKARVGIRRDGHNSYGDYVELYDNEWTKISWSRYSANGEDDGILISVLESEDEERPPIYVGAAWLGTSLPPEDWLDKI